jgi:hypothetical protein
MTQVKSGVVMRNDHNPFRLNLAMDKLYLSASVDPGNILHNNGWSLLGNLRVGGKVLKMSCSFHTMTWIMETGVRFTPDFPTHLLK